MAGGVLPPQSRLPVRWGVGGLLPEAEEGGHQVAYQDGHPAILATYRDVDPCIDMNRWSRYVRCIVGDAEGWFR
ncbi:hypothetical protein Cme02nite_04780 [Catellatospora methionotrophica]|uniref:Uncharacterized protein n=1 Tax=Catellatospora methionotrophica TaxID=121620 RepID=A0A8J3PEG7_9ACTN|nr:hypothetical protein Cme02nite_04780 [Catellatospora methionotrophica]